MEEEWERRTRPEEEEAPLEKEWTRDEPLCRSRCSVEEIEFVPFNF